MNNISLRQLRAFIAVAESGSFRRAAERLLRSQSAISVTIQQLEAELGMPLFHRTTRRVRLTEVGGRFLGRARNALGELQLAVAELKDEVEMQRGRVRLGTSPTISSTRLPRVLAAFQARYPAVAIDVQEDFALPVLDKVRNGAVDFAIGPRVAPVRDLDFKPILKDPFRAVLPPDYDLDGRTEIALGELATAPFLAMPRASALRMVLEEAFHGLGHILSPRFEVSHHLTLIGMVEAGLGVTVLPALCLPARGYGEVQTAAVVAPHLEREIDLITLKGQALAPAALRLAAMIEDGFLAPDPAGRHAMT